MRRDPARLVLDLMLMLSPMLQLVLTFQSAQNVPLMMVFSIASLPASSSVSYTS